MFLYHVDLLLLTVYINLTSHMCTHTGELPYKELSNTVILSRVVAEYRLDSPEGCPEQM